MKEIFLKYRETLDKTITHHIVHQLRPVPPDRFDGLKHVHLAVLDDLLDASVRRTVHARPATTVTGVWKE